MDGVPRHDIVIVMGDWNAKIGGKKEGENGVNGNHALLGGRNDNGERFVAYCAANNLAITSTMYPHKYIHKYTWTSTNGRYRNQIDDTAQGPEERTSSRRPVYSLRQTP